MPPSPPFPPPACPRTGMRESTARFCAVCAPPRTPQASRPQPRPRPPRGPPRPRPRRPRGRRPVKMPAIIAPFWCNTRDAGTRTSQPSAGDPATTYGFCAPSRCSYAYRSLMRVCVDCGCESLRDGSPLSLPIPTVHPLHPRESAFCLSCGSALTVSRPTCIMPPGQSTRGSSCALSQCVTESPTGSPTTPPITTNPTTSNPTTVPTTSPPTLANTANSCHGVSDAVYCQALLNQDPNFCANPYVPSPATRHRRWASAARARL